MLSSCKTYWLYLYYHAESPGVQRSFLFELNASKTVPGVGLRQRQSLFLYRSWRWSFRAPSKRILLQCGWAQTATEKSFRYQTFAVAAIMEKNVWKPAPSIPALYTPLCNFVENVMFIINDNIIINIVLHTEGIFLNVLVVRALTGS